MTTGCEGGTVATGKTNGLFYDRQRLHTLLEDAVKRPLVIVTAGMGYGKTRAVECFLQKAGISATWIQLTAQCNLATRFWENYVHAASIGSEGYARHLTEIGFPDSDDTFTRFALLTSGTLKPDRQYAIVLDDFHLINDASVLRFVDRLAHYEQRNMRLILISRSVPSINFLDLMSEDRFASLDEEELRFTEAEIAAYYSSQSIPLGDRHLKDVYATTGGWAFAINLLARSLAKSPDYVVPALGALKQNIFKLIESEILQTISPRLKRLLTRLSLIDRLATDLVRTLAGDDALVEELEQLSAYVRHDFYLNVYHVHHLFMDLLSQNQNCLTVEEKHDTYAKAAEWCCANDFYASAITYYENIGAYSDIVAVLFRFQAQMPRDVALLTKKIFDNAPKNVFDTVDFSAVTHVRALVSAGMIEDAFRMAEKYAHKYNAAPQTAFAGRMLGGLYYCMGVIRQLMSTIDGRFDFHEYFALGDEHFTRSPFPIYQNQIENNQTPPWFSHVGDSSKGAPEAYIAALAEAAKSVAHCLKGGMAGIDDCARGELAYYRNDLSTAESFLRQGLSQAWRSSQYDIAHRALTYLMLIAFAQGDLSKAEEALREVDSQLDETDYSARYITCAITRAYYCYMLRMPEQFSAWLRGRITPYGHSAFIENYGNQLKVRYYYITKQYGDLFAYTDEMLQRESILYGRINVLALTACARYLTKDKAAAFVALRLAYYNARDNGIIMPFIEMGKDMRTLAASALRSGDSGIPDEWLETIQRKASAYAKQQAHVIAVYRAAHPTNNDVPLSQREKEVLVDLSHGLSRSEIAAHRQISINTVKLVINSLYDKLGASSLADALRFAMEKKIMG
ncbi:MAG: LuxR C-terminal-related transcriptional regulator [Oscillospiraceae bacterium]|jgi:LuxR family maltose regulon positive regulatory protein|nr:LuxR C-terminal-related transcriptional regulator [Oscillospiraceae bacterium]